MAIKQKLSPEKKNKDKKTTYTTNAINFPSQHKTFSKKNKNNIEDV